MCANRRIQEEIGTRVTPVKGKHILRPFNTSPKLCQTTSLNRNRCTPNLRFTFLSAVLLIISMANHRKAVYYLLKFSNCTKKTPHRKNLKKTKIHPIDQYVTMTESITKSVGESHPLHVNTFLDHSTNPQSSFKPRLSNEISAHQISVSNSVE